MRHAPEVELSLEDALDLIQTDDWEAAVLPWSPLAELGTAMPCGACEDTCTCEEVEDDGRDA